MSGPTLLPAVFVRLSATVANATSLPEIYDAALAGIRDVLAIERASILLFDPDGVLRFKAWSGLSDDYRRAVEGHTPWLPDSAPPDPILVGDVRDDPSLAAYEPVLAREGIRALAFVPLVSQQRVIGKFVLYHAEPHEFSKEEIDIALAMAHHIGFAVERTHGHLEKAKLYQETQAALAHEADVRERLTVLTRGSERLLTTLSADSIVQQVLDLAKDVIPASGYAVWLLRGTSWCVAGSFGLSEAFTRITLPRNQRIKFDGPVVAEDVKELPGLGSRSDDYEREGIRSLVSIPLAVRGETAGSIVFYYRAPRARHELELRVAMALGHLAAAAISNAELYSEQRRTADRAAFMAEASACLSSLNCEESLHRLAELAVPRVADWCAVDLREDDGSVRRLATSGEPANDEVARELERAYSITSGDVSVIRRVLRTGDASLEPPGDDAGTSQYGRGILSAIVVPLAIGRRTFGTLTLARFQRPRRYGPADLRFATELARRVALAVENARLYVDAQEANRLKDDFLAALSHELRTPLNAILGWTAILSTDFARSQLERGLSVIRRNAEAQSRLVNDLLDASRISRGRLKIEVGDLDLRAPIVAAVETIRPAALGKGVQLHVDLPSQPCNIKGDESRLQQVFWNVLSNAVKFTSARGCVDVSLVCDTGQAVTRITDTGIGIKPEFLPFMFDRFRQADPSTTRAHGGLGLGLALARQLTEMHGGAIDATSEGEGRGARITVTLPLNVTAEPALGVSTSVPALPCLERRRVLAVDDDESSLEMLEALLTGHGAEVVLAGSATEALALIADVRPHVLISDLAMPDRDGYWLIEQVRQLDDPFATTMATVAVTACAASDVRARALSAGFDAYLIKPIDPLELVRIVHRLSTTPVTTESE